jgi:hypothetical protein
MPRFKPINLGEMQIHKAAAKNYSPYNGGQKENGKSGGIQRSILPPWLMRTAQGKNSI